MNRITTLYFRRIPSGLGFGHKIESHATCTAVRLYASGGVKSGGRGGAAATSSKKSPSLSKHSPPELKNINATLSPSSIASNSTAGKPSTMATTAAVPRESIGSKTRRGGTGSFPNFSRNLAEMCTKQ
ncbi:hypothetical protein BX616_010734 [Lobosporangium transversale]|nr:hypothetical protein BX616_010734 [Lobosporangium transversale]